MKVIMKSLFAFALLFSFTLPAGASEVVIGAGATFPYPVYSAWAYAYNKATGVQLNYQSIGSGGGIRQITSRTVDFGASDNPMKPEELAKAKLLQFPAVMGGVVPVVNIQGIREGQLRLDGDSLGMIFLGKIKFWDDARIKAMNPSLSLPHAEITVVHRSDGSGTTAIFSNYLSGASKDWEKTVGFGPSVKWPAGIGGKGNEGVANYVRRTANSIGYVEFAYAKQNRMAYTALKNKAGNFVEPSFASFENAAETGDFDPRKGFYLWLTNSPGKQAWPIAAATYILLAQDRKSSSMKTVKFYDWAFTKGDAKAKELVYIPLPQSLKEKVRAYWKANGIY
ncbi:MAG: phosphate ABC transporter substrate-binding protein PstS [Thermodesulfovibrionales bacterium]|jgi:phosphate transport system substrate-binding protein